MRLKRTGYKSEWLIIEYRKSTGWKIPWRKACGKTKTETGRHQEGSSLLEEVEDTSRGWRYPGANWRWRILAGDGDIRGRTARAVAALKFSRKGKVAIRKCHCTDIDR